MGTQYKKRSGTSGISGHLYETKLISLLSHRLQRNDHVEEYSLATNVDEMGAFDDICIVMKIVGRDQPIALFIQVKHKENDGAFLTLDHKNDLLKWFDSYLKIKKKICSWINCLNATEADCVFILYTNAGFAIDLNTSFESSYAATINNLIATSDTVGCWPLYSQQHIEECSDYYLKKDLEKLSEHFVMYLNNKTKQSMNIMNDEYIQRYHVILIQKVVDVTDVHTEEQNPDLKYRTLTFHPNFFDTNDKHIKFFRDTLIEEVLKKYPTIRTNGEMKHPSTNLSTQELSTDELISSFLVNPSFTTLIPLIITHITCNKSGKLEFLIKRCSNDMQKLQQIIISRHEIDKAYFDAKMVAVKYLQSLKLKVPIGFGNADVIISGSTKKIERRLKYMTAIIVNLCKQYEQNGPYKIVKIDDNKEHGILSSSGGLASAVGNILIYDKLTKLLKFSTEFTSLQKNAITLYQQLTNVIDNLHEYRFDVKTMKFPEIHLNRTNLIEEFLSRLVVYAKQSNHYEVEQIFKKEIQVHLNGIPRNFLIKSDSVFLYYHDIILNWWMSPKTGSYLTKTSNLYEQVINNLVTETQISALYTTFYINNSRYFAYSFNENATKWMELPELPSKFFIVTNTITLTTVKVIQCLRNHYSYNEYTVLDLEYVLELPHAKFCLLNREITESTKGVIMICRNIQTQSRKLNEIVEVMRNRQLIIVTNEEYIKDIFMYKHDIVKDETQCLTAMTPNLQRKIRKRNKVIFQGQTVSLGLMVDDVSVKFIKDGILDTIICNETIDVGKSILNSAYRNIKDVYIDRRVRIVTGADSDSNCNDGELVRTFHDIKKEVVLVTATPGMGKSTLLTHLSLQTKQRYQKFWIVRVNFLDHSKKFYKWHKHKTVIDCLEALTFLCQVALINEITSFSLKITNKEACLVNCVGSEIATFELNMFLHFYNKYRLIFVFDGFDEICPHYKDKVVDFLNVARTDLRKNKMWVTSRPYTDILPDLRKLFGRYFEILHLNNKEQEAYLEKFWRLNLSRMIKLKPILLLKTIENIELSIYISHHWIIRIYCIFYNFIHPYLRKAPLNDEERHSLHRRFDRRYNSHRSVEAETLTGVPLLLYVIASFFTKNVFNYGEINMYNIYQMFIENKIKEILYKDKNKMDLYNPDVIMKCRKELTDCMLSNKKLAAYALLRDPIFKELNFVEFIDMNPLNNEKGEAELKAMLINIKTGADKIGLISHVTADNIPVFIHRTFTEYFAAEYVCDILKSVKFNLDKKILWLNATSECCNRGLLDWIDIKMKIDTELPPILREIEKKEPQPLYNTPYSTYFDRKNLSKSQLIRIMSSSFEDYQSGCFDKYANLLNDRNEDVNETEPDAKQKQRSDFTSYIISKMKPHLNKHFPPDST